MLTLAFTTCWKCSTGHRLKASYHNKLGFISLAQTAAPHAACHAVQRALPCQWTVASGAHLPKALQSWALLLLHQQSSSPTQCTALFPPHTSPSLNAGFLLVGNRQIFDRLRTSSCANSSCGVSSQADTMKARMLPKVNFESVYITVQRFLSRLHPHNSMVMHCNITAHLYLQPHDSLLMKQ